MKLRVGVVGLGPAWETRHRPALRALSDRFEVRAVCDEVAVRAEQAARDFSAQPVEGFRALATRPDVDVLLMLGLQWYGYLPILAACEAGKSVYCGTNINLDLAQAEQIKKHVEQSGVAFMTEFPRRQAPATLRLKELIATRLGAPRLLFCHLRLPSETRPPAPAHQEQAQPMTNELLELIDWCRYVVAREPTSVMGHRHREAGSPSQIDYQMMNLDFSEPGKLGEGPTAQLSCGHYFPSSWREAVAYRPPAAMQVSCEHGIAFIDLPSTLVWFDEAGRHQEALDSERPVGEQSLIQFFRSVTSLVRNMAGLDDTFAALAILNEAQRSFAEGRRVQLEL